MAASTLSKMNTRIQVEHPVTEMVTSLDLVKSQILLATGAKITDIIPKVDRKGQRGHAIECRINAEHPEKFTPSAGKIKTFHIPGGLGVRVDTAAYAEGVIPPYYDSLIAKLITFGKDRPEAIMRMQRALEMFIVEGIHTTIPLHRRILADAEFRAGNIDTKYVERLLARMQEERSEVVGAHLDSDQFSRKKNFCCAEVFCASRKLFSAIYSNFCTLR